MLSRLPASVVLTSVLGFAIALLLFAVPAAAVSVDILAIDTASPRVNLGGVDTNDDNRLRVYYNALNGIEIDGFIKFDLSSIPDTSVITSMNLTLFQEGPRSGSPEVQVRRSSFDGWVRGGSGFPTTYDEVLTPIQSGFTGGQHVPYTFSLDVGAVNWTLDLLDDRLSLVLDQNTAETAVVYFYGSDPVSPTGDSNSTGTVYDYVPRLSIEYSVIPEPSTASLLAIGLVGLAARRRSRAGESLREPI
jgi:hypothetical protein